MGIKVENSSPLKSTGDYIKKDVDTLFFQRYWEPELEQQSNLAPAGLRILRDFYPVGTKDDRSASFARVFRGLDAAIAPERPIWETNKMAVTAIPSRRLKRSSSDLFSVVFLFFRFFFSSFVQLAGDALVGHTCQLSIRSIELSFTIAKFEETRLRYEFMSDKANNTDQFLSRLYRNYVHIDVQIYSVSLKLTHASEFERIAWKIAK